MGNIFKKDIAAILDSVFFYIIKKMYIFICIKIIIEDFITKHSQSSTQM